MKVAVVGGGVSGLAATVVLARAGVEVTLLEAGRQLGGKIAGADLAGLRVDVGAESMLLTGRPAAQDLVDSLGLELVGPSSAGSRLLIDGRALPVPRSLLGVPASAEDVAGVLSEEGLAAARREPELPAPELHRDTAVGDLVAQRFGDEVVDRLLEPLLGGVYAGHARALSFAAVNPRLWEAARSGGALSAHAAALLPPPQPGRSPFTGVRGGMHLLVTALREAAEAAGATILTGSPVRELERVGGRWRLTTGSVPDPRTLDSDAVLLAVPAPAAARLLADRPRAAVELAAVRYASPAVIALQVSGVDPEGSGLLIPPGGLATVKAVTHSDRKWPWLAELVESSWGGGVHLVRASVGRAGEESLLQVGDEELVRRAVEDLRRLPGWQGLQVSNWIVRRWGGGLPQYAVGHLDRMAAVTEEVARIDGLEVCGAAYAGVGIGPCLEGAVAAAGRLMAGTSGADGAPEGGRR